MNIVKIVITGGPCAGKSTIINSIITKLAHTGWKTFIVQETATRIFSSGCEISAKGLSWYQFQEQLFLRQIDEENFVKKMAEQHTYENVVLLYDRGLMDGEAYLSHEEFESIIINNGYVKKEIRDNRYDLIIHLVTAANGAEAFYTLENNQTRKETIEEARILDKKTQAAWQDHPNLHIIDNSTPFAEKVDRTIEKINSFLKYFTQ